MNFYVLRNPTSDESSTATEFFQVEPIAVAEPDRCPLCKRSLGPLRWLPPYRVELEVWGKQFGDIAFGSGNNLLVSGRFKELWYEAKLKGLEGFESVEIVKIQHHRKTSSLPPNYCCARVQTSRAAIDVIRSELQRDDTDQTEICPECRRGGIIKRTERIILEDGTWSDEDIFIARGLPGTYITSERLRGFCKANQIQNALLIPATTFSFDFYPWEQEH